MYSVYKHTTPSGKVYIGITSLEPEKRWNNGKGYQKNYHFFNAILKYGWDNIEHSVLHSDLAQSAAQEIEAQLIAQYHSDNPQYGYNHTVGGEISVVKYKTVLQYTKEGEFVAEYNSLKEACEYTGANPGSVSCVCSGKRRSANGFVWKYKETA